MHYADYNIYRYLFFMPRFSEKVAFDTGGKDQVAS
jgi:hypothetical protein